MKNLLWISLRAPYDKVPHGGGKTHNFYIKEFYKSGKFNIHLISFCYTAEEDKIDLDFYGISNDISVIKRNKSLRNLLQKIGLPPSLVEYKFVVREVKRKLKKLCHNDYSPDIIILQWTEIVMLSQYIKTVFPKAKIVSIEEDVTFLKIERKLDSGHGLKKILYGIQYKLIGKREIKGLEKSDLVALNNHKDYELVLSKGLDKGRLFKTSPYFENYSYINRRPLKGEIIFWGAMNRPENEEAVLWFVNNVLCKLKNVKFTVIGANPTQKILDLTQKGIRVTGFVDKPDIFFEQCMCMVVPLQMGAGIKIKVLEAMSAGIPVLTNYIGIEGIYASDEKQYLHCETADEYIAAINRLLEDKTFGEELGRNSLENVKERYSIFGDIQKFINRVERLNEK